MKTSAFRLFTVASLLVTLTLTSCAPYGPGYGYGDWGGYGAPSRADAAVGGALLGAAAGGIIGNQSRRGLEGAAIGGIIGALAGGAIQQSRERRAAQSYGYGQPYGGYQGGHCQPSNPGYYNNSGYYPSPSYGYQQPYSPYGW
ncbi:MAG: hypothetical protein JNN17_19615 [Verrucomicrobiaceae bacterium]|nr:hypothetical protein [Verrucomicrobiaceae bacterium]